MRATLLGDTIELEHMEQAYRRIGQQKGLRYILCLLGNFLCCIYLRQKPQMRDDIQRLQSWK